MLPEMPDLVSVYREVREMKHIGTLDIETKQLLLRKQKIEDAADIFCIYGDSSIVPDPHENTEQTKNELKTWIKFYDKMDSYAWGIELKAIKKIIGVIFTAHNDEQNKSCTISYKISRNHWNNGYATEALYHVIRFLLFDVGYNRVDAGHFIDNPASGRVMEKAGMKYEGTLRQSHFNWKTGAFIDTKVYGIIKEDMI